MIKVIAADMDGTLLNSEHTMSERTYQTILKAQKAGLRFMIATGRDYPGALGALGQRRLICDFITGSGAEIRSERGNLLQTITMDPAYFKEIYSCCEKVGGAIRFCANGTDYLIGDQETIEERLLAESRVFLGKGTDEEIREMKLFHQLMERVRCISSMEEVIRQNIPVYKIFISTPDGETAQKMREEMGKIPHLAVASSFYNNVELTDEKAQKGTAIRTYMESLGYGKEEVMVLGDSLNDLSMFTEGFGAAVAMENAEPVIRDAAGYVTKSNDEDGAAYAIHLLMEGRLEQLRKITI
ncbi:MAG: Cof-type HAD-IIB family hydrolase [Ruminococcus sp.]|jgi:Cof subfamily protein (haloacid dehalogenase superfamily)